MTFFGGPVVTIVVVSYRTPALARHCVETVRDHADVTCQVCVVDTSGGEGAITSTGWLVGVPVYCTDNVGYAAALNFGFEGARTPFLIACNADVEFPPDGIRALLDLFHGDPKLALVGPRQVSPDGRIVHAGIEVAGDTSGGRGYGEPDTGQYRERLLEVEQVSGSVMVMRRDVFEAVGRMTGIKLYYEDALFALRLRRAGYRVAYSGVRTFIHHVAASPQPPEGRAALARESRAVWEETVRFPT